MAFLSSGRPSPSSSPSINPLNPISPSRDRRNEEVLTSAPVHTPPQPHSPAEHLSSNNSSSFSAPPPSSALELEEEAPVSVAAASVSVAAAAAAAAVGTAADTSRSTTPGETAEQQLARVGSDTLTLNTNLNSSAAADDAFILKMAPAGKLISEEMTSPSAWAECSKLSHETAANTREAASSSSSAAEASSAAAAAGGAAAAAAAAGGGESKEETTNTSLSSCVESPRGVCTSLCVDREKCSSLLVPCLAVFSSNYNFVVTSIALFIMNQDEVYRQTLESVVGNGTIKMLSYAGAIVGMCVMGNLGDLIGRRLAMILTLFLVGFGALGSSLFSWGSALSITIIIGVFRFILGVGSGGVYPLSAVTAAESTNSTKEDDRCLRVSLAYSMNVPGILFPYILSLFLWWLTSGSIEICFRVLLCFGCIPAFFVWLPAWRLKDSKEYIHPNITLSFLNIFIKKTYWRSLLGTGVCWLLYDVTAYGVLLVQPEITEVIWGKKTQVEDIIKQNIFLNSIGIPGCYMGILVLRKMGVKWLQFWGFIGLAFSCFLLSAAACMLQQYGWPQLIILSIINFFINWGASITTFILPSVVFPPSVRSTYSGVSAALGKVGAVAGIYIMKVTLSNWGLSTMMICAAVPSLLAAVLTFFFVQPQSASAALKDCFSSLGGCIPFVDCRRRRKI